MPSCTANVASAAFDRILRFAVRLLCVVCIAGATGGYAQTRAGTMITNQSSAQFEWFGVEYRVNSNIVYNTVSPVYGVSIRPDGTVEQPALIGYGVALQTVVYSYILTNTGNTVDSFDLRLPFLPERSTVEPLDRRIFLDVNGNGRLDAGESATMTNAVERLAPGDFVYLLVALQVPLRAKVDDTFYFDLQAVSRGDPAAQDTGNVNRTIVPADAVLQLEKSVTPTLALPGQSIRYELNVQNTGVAAARGVDVIVDGAPRTGILVYDPVPYNDKGGLTYLPGSIEAAPAGGFMLFSSDGRLTWRTAPTAADEPPAAEITDVGYLFTTELEPNQQAQFVFRVSVPSDMEPGRIENRGEVHYRLQSGVEASDTATNAVIVDVLPTVHSVYIGPENAPRAEGETDINDDLTLDGGINPETNDDYRVAGSFVFFTNTVENAATGDDVLNIQLDPTIAGSAEAEEAGRMRQLSEKTASGLPRTTLPKGWLVQFISGDGATPLRDTNGDGLVDVGALRPGQAANVIVRLYIPPNTVTDDNDGAGFQAVIRASSSIDPDQFNLTVDRIPKVESLTTFWDNFKKEQFLPDVVEPGSKVTYRNTFGHSGNFIVFNAIIIDELSPYLTVPEQITSGVIRNLKGDGFVNVTGEYDAVAHRIIWMIPVIPSDFLGQLEFTATIAEETPPGEEIENAFTIQSEMTPSVRVSNLVRLVSGAASAIDLRKTANREEAVIGDPVLYTINVTNKGPTEELTSLTLYDDLARGFHYRQGTAKVDGEPLEPEVLEDGTQLVWQLPGLAVGESHEITYVTIVTPEAPMGNGVNTATAEAVFPLGSSARVTATADVEIVESALSPVSTIIGRVYVDANDNRIVDPGEPGIEGVRIYMDDGTYVLTDRDGLYSIPGVRGKTRTLRVDQSTLDKNYVLQVIDDRNAGDPASVFVDVRHGLLRKVNFRVLALDESLTGEAGAPAKALALHPPRVETVDGGARLTLGWGSTDNPQVFVERQTGLVLVSIPGVADISGLRDAIFTDPLFQSVRIYVDETSQQTRVQLRLQKRTEGYGTEEVRTTAGEGFTTIEVGDPVAWAAHDPKVEILRKDLSEEDMDAAGMTRPLILSPSDGTAYTSRDKINVRASAPMSATARLLVNGEPVPDTLLGEKALNIPERRTYYNYSSVPLRAGLNTLTFESTHRGRKDVAEVRVALADRPESIELAVAPQPLYADGTTEPVVGITLLDASGLPTGEATVVTVEVDKGSVESPDFRPTEPGFQTQIRDGRATIRLSHAAHTETRRLRVTLGDVTQEAEVFFAPYLRDWIVVGTFEGTLGFSDIQRSDRAEDDNGENEFLTGDQGSSLFFKGTLPWHDIVVTGNYDSTRRREDTRLFRQFQPDDYYPVYGDDSELGYEAPSRDPYYLKLERGESYVMYGDFDTDMDESELAGNTRRFTGAKTDIKTDYVDVKGYAAYTDQAMFRVEIPGQGVSGYYQLPHRNIIRGSEKIIIETRDRDRPTEVISTEELRPYEDYNFDYRIGRVLFKKPIRAYDANFNPLYVVVWYELEDDDQRDYWTYGGRAAVHDKDRNVTVGASQLVTQGAQQNDTVQGVDATVRLTDTLTARAEYARSNTQEHGKDNAYLAELENEDDTYSYNLYYRRIGEDFDNEGMRGSTSGREEYGVEAEIDLEGPWALRTDSFIRKDVSSDLEEKVGIVDGVYTRGRTEWLLGGGYVASREGEAQDDAGPVARLGVITPISDRWELELLHQETFADIVGEQPTRTTGTLRFQATESTATTLAVERRKARDGSFDTNVEMGAETIFNEHLSYYNRYGVDGGANGWAGRTNHGFEANYPMTEQTRVLFGGEIVNRMHGPASATRQQNFWTVNGGIEYAPLDKQMLLTLRNEFRHDERRNQFFTEMGGTTKLDKDNTLFARNRLTYSYDTEEKEDEWIIDFLTGWAYRPLGDDELNLISDFEVRYETGNGGIVTNEVHEFIVSTEAVWQPVESWTFNAKYAARLTLAGYSDATFSDVKAVAARHYFWKRFYGQAGFRWLEQYDTDTHDLSYGLEGGFSPMKNVQIGVGYNFEGFLDRSFERGDYWERGVYVRIRVKFDESVLGWLQWMDERREEAVAQ